MTTTFTLLDGGMSRELMRVGAPFRQPEWSALALLDGPEWVARVHRSFVDAGADVLTTNSYAVVPFHLGEERFAERGRELHRMHEHAADRSSCERVVENLPARVSLEIGARGGDAGEARRFLDGVFEARPTFVAGFAGDDELCLAKSQAGGEDFCGRLAACTGQVPRDACGRVGVAARVGAAKVLRAFALLLEIDSHRPPSEGRLSASPVGRQSGWSVET